MKDNKGQALVEFIIILPLLLLIIISIIDFGNIFTKKYSLENDLDTIVDLYETQEYSKINDYTNNKNIEINYKEENNFLTINLSKDIKIYSPILNTILGNSYSVNVDRSVYVKR